MLNVILVLIMIGCSFGLGYSVRAYRHPVQKRDKSGRFLKG